MVWKYLVISGGGFKGFAFISSLIEMENIFPNFKKNIEIYVGTSAGALISFAYAIGYSPKEILLIGNEFYGIMKKNLQLSLENMKQGGLFDNEFLYKFIQAILIEKKIKKEITFLELYQKYKIHFTTCGFNLNSLNTDFFDYINNPQMEIAKAIQISTCVPGIFCPILYNGRAYIDGGILHNFPIEYLLKKDLNQEQILGITNFIIYNIDELPIIEKITPLFYSDLFMLMYQKFIKKQYEILDKENYIIFPNKKKGLKFAKQIFEEKIPIDEYLIIGKEQTHIFIQNWFLKKRSKYISKKYLIIWKNKNKN